MLEGRLQTQIIHYLESRGAWVFNPLAGPHRAGIPDLLIIYQGLFIGMELKRPHGTYRPTFVQKKNLQAITDAGGLGAVVCSLAFVKALLLAIDEDDDDWFTAHGYLSHGQKELVDDSWMEECLW